jgi:hypothetical protein
VAEFRYSFADSGYNFIEKIQFAESKNIYDNEALTRALNLAHLLIGTSYFKAFPTPNVGFSRGGIDEWQADFLNKVYQEGLSQFAFENGLTRADLAHFSKTAESKPAVAYEGTGVLSLQSGGKDSLLVASMLNEKKIDFTSLYVTSSDQYPKVIDDIGQTVRLIKRRIDRDMLKKAAEHGAKNGHVPVTYIVLAISLVQAILDGKNTVLAAIGHEGEEPHALIDDLPVNHQWSKTWDAERLFAEYVTRYVSPDINIGSPLRQYSELKIAELFVQKAWSRYKRDFSSCNIANYGQGVNNKQLTWCGNCPKCANSYLLFAPFVDPEELKSLLGGEDLFLKPSLIETFKGLLGIDGVMKPFECVGEIDELRLAYQKALENGYLPLPFEVPHSAFDYERKYQVHESVKSLK